MTPPEPTQTVRFTILKGRYLLESELGRGGFGITYLAIDRDVASRKVVVKILNERRALDSWHSKKFRGEMEALARIDHPNVVGVIDFGESADGQQFLVMQFIPGGTLRSAIQHEALPLPDAAAIVRQMGSALTAAHQAGVVHRDIKPENIMLRSTVDGGHQVKLIDFGVASLLASDESSLTATISGTWSYMAPEQFEGKSSPMSDVFQMGVVAFEMVTGKVPFHANHPAGVALQQRDGLKETPRQIRADLPESAEEAILKALALNPADRFQSAKEFGDTLSAALGGAPGSELYRVSQKTSARTPVRRSKTASLMGLGAVLAGLAVWGFLKFVPMTPAPDFVAVLPFENRTGDPELAYLAGGITEALIGDLSRIPTLRVSAFGSVQKYDRPRTDARAAGRELGATRVIDGSISKRDGGIFVNTELIDVKIGTRTWGNSYSTNLSSITEIIQTFSNEVTDQLRLKLSGPLKERLKRQYSVGSRSYEQYLKARYHLNKRTAADFTQAIQYFEDVLAGDPQYAPAEAGLADTYAKMATFGPFWSGAEPREALEHARAAAMKALQLDGTLAEAYNALAMAEINADYDWKAARHNYQRSIELNPNFGETHENYALELAALGQSGDAIREIDRAEELEPDNSHFRAAHGLILYMGRRYDDSLKIYGDIAKAPGGAARVADVMAMNYWMKSMPAEAMKVLERMPQGFPQLTVPLTITGYARVHQREKAREILNNYLLPDGKFWWYHLAVAHLNMGQPEDAIRDLEKAWEQRWWDVIWIGVDPLFDTLRSSPGFQKLLVNTRLTPI